MNRRIPAYAFLLSLSSLSRNLYAAQDTQQALICHRPNSGLCQLPGSLQSNLIAVALQKFSTKCLEKMNLGAHDSAPFKDNVDTYERFYHTMILVHIRHQNYVEDFLFDRVSFNHIVGLALTYHAYNDLDRSDLSILQNKEFLTHVYIIYDQFQKKHLNLLEQWRAMRAMQVLENRSLNETNTKLEKANQRLKDAYDELESAKDLQRLELSTTRQKLFEIERRFQLLSAERSTEVLEAQQHIKELMLELQELKEEKELLISELRALKKERPESLE
jgi:hypothetical protein